MSAEQKSNMELDEESPFPSSPRVIYSANPLVEVICQLRFPAILRIDSELPVAFQERIRAQYPDLRERTDVIPGLPGGMPLQISELLRSSLAARHRAVGFDFLSSDGLWTVGLTREFLSLGTTRYERWEAFREHLAEPFQALLDIYRPNCFTRVGLRYQDLIKRTRMGLEGRPWASLLQPHIAGLLSSDLNAEISATFAQTVIGFRRNLGQVTLRHGLVQEADGPETCYLFDADFFTDQRIENENAYEKLDYFNHQSGRLFRWCISNVLHEAMGPQPVQR